jgi:hypothetical protein
VAGAQWHFPSGVQDQVDTIYFMGFDAQPQTLLLNQKPQGLLSLLVSFF